MGYRGVGRVGNDRQRNARSGGVLGDGAVDLLLRAVPLQCSTQVGLSIDADAGQLCGDIQNIGDP